MCTEQTCTAGFYSDSYTLKCLYTDSIQNFLKLVNFQIQLATIIIIICYLFAFKLLITYLVLWAIMTHGYIWYCLIAMFTHTQTHTHKCVGMVLCVCNYIYMPVKFVLIMSVWIHVCNMGNIEHIVSYVYEVTIAHEGINTCSVTISMQVNKYTWQAIQQFRDGLLC